MTLTDDSQVQVLFRYYSDPLDEVTEETMWATIVDKAQGIYKLNNIPFYGPLIAPEDEFYAEYSEVDKMLSFKEVTKPSGNSVVLILITRDEFNSVLLTDQLEELNCNTERLNDQYFSVEIPKTEDYSNIKKVLDNYEGQDILDYAEPCLSDKHQKDI